MSDWFAAHVILYVAFKEGHQTAFPVWENIVLIEADSEEDAFKKAERRGRQDEGDDDGTLTWGGKLARWVFGGVRKLTLCQNSEERPGDGTEISYIQLRVRSESALKKLIRSERVGVEYRDVFSDETEQDREDAVAEP